MATGKPIVKQNTRRLPTTSVKVVSKCRVCKQVDTFEVPKVGLKHRRKGKLLVDAFPDLDPTRVRQLSDHLCPACQKNY